MSYLLDGVLPAYPSWRNYFDVIVVSAAKPIFFTEEHPFIEVDGDGSWPASPPPAPSSGARSTRAAT
jgi:hypothetical protein